MFSAHIIAHITQCKLKIRRKLKYLDQDDRCTIRQLADLFVSEDFFEADQSKSTKNLRHDVTAAFWLRMAFR